jgi:mono/diheme cytochrome c family protein
MPGPRKFDHRYHLPSLHFIGVLSAVVLALGAVFIYAGIYNIGADAPHASTTTTLIEGLRERSIAVRARNIKVPANLDSAERIAGGAGLYAEMCTGCHLGPGMAPTEMSQGLYPQAPVFKGKSEQSPREQFWAIKHGIKMTAMPAWGVTHNDDLIWNMVAFLQKLPSMSQADYDKIVSSAPAGHDEMMEGMDGMAGSHHDAPTKGEKPAENAHPADGHAH